MEPAVRTFWQDFDRLQRKLIEEGEALGETYDALLESVQRINPNLFLEMCVNGTPREFIITAEARKELFPLVESIVRDAPPVKGWTFLALKPKLGWGETCRWESVQVRVADILFAPMSSSTGEFGIKLHVPGLHPQNEDAAHAALIRLLHHALGERAFAEQISATFIASMPEDKSELIELTDLEAYLAWRRKKE